MSSRKNRPPETRTRAQQSMQPVERKTVPLVIAAILALVAFIAALVMESPEGGPVTPAICALTFIAAICALVWPGAARPLTKPERVARAGAASLVIVAALSFLWSWVIGSHGTMQYVDPMLRGVAYWSAMAALVYIGATQIGRSRAALYAVLVAVAAAAGISAAIGTQDYLINAVRNHITGWREFGTSANPDYYAGYLLITIPITLGLFLAAPAAPGKRAAWLYGFALLLQLAVFPTTGSRFALISFVVMIAALAGGLLLARRSGLQITRAMRIRLIGLTILAVIGSAAFAGPILHRLQANTLKQQAHSGDFRVYTWRGSLHLAEHYPVLGAGPNMFAYAYPKYAVVGFTRVAHSGYLQVLDDLGALGLASVLALFVGCLWAAGAALRRPVPDGYAQAEQQSPLLANIAPENAREDRIVLIGLASGVIAALVQNLIDSDWNMTICGATLFLAAGLTLGMSTQLSALQSTTDSTLAPAKREPWRLGLAALAALLTVACACWAAAGESAVNGDYGQAAQLAPWNGEYYSSLGWREFRTYEASPQLGTGNWLLEAEGHLSRAIALTPSAVTYFRRARLYDASSRPQQALADIRSGLMYDPHALELLLLGAQISDKTGDHAAAIQYYQQMADEQQGPYGIILAISEVGEYRYAYADAALGADALQRGDTVTAIRRLLQARSILETYVQQGGSTNPYYRMAAGSSADNLDAELQALYSRVVDILQIAYLKAGMPKRANLIRTEAKTELPQFIHQQPSPQSVQP